MLLSYGHNDDIAVRLVSQVILCNWPVAASWRHKARQNQRHLKIEAFARLSRGVLAEIEEKISRLQRFWGNSVKMEMTQFTGNDFLAKMYYDRIFTIFRVL